ncbi:MAG TPA: hypothetical protein VF710_10120 [Longimicrobium sp.]|jgi:hypothetical protein
MSNGEANIDHEAIRTGSIPWSADELDHVLHHARGMEEAVHIAAARARELHLDMMTAMAHGMRLFAIFDFLRDNHDRLYECGLLLPRDTDIDLISNELLEVLATFPLTVPTGDTGAGGKDHLGFDADDVIIEAGSRQKALDDSNPE